MTANAHGLITDHNGDPRCQCGWAPAPDECGSGINGQLRAASMIRRHAAAPFSITSLTTVAGTHVTLDGHKVTVTSPGEGTRAVGQVIDGCLAPEDFVRVALGPDVLRTIATLIEMSTPTNGRGGGER